MSTKEKFDKAWKDPVWSKVIAQGILSVFVLFGWLANEAYTAIDYQSISQSFKDLFSTFRVPSNEIWIVVDEILLVVFVLVTGLIWRKQLLRWLFKAKEQYDSALLKVNTLEFTTLPSPKKPATLRLAFEINSDHNVQFLGSSTYPHLPHNHPAYAFTLQIPWKNVTGERPELAKAKWVAHSALHTDDHFKQKEMKAGGVYNFSRRFMFSEADYKRIRKMELYFLVDDHCDVYFNGKYMGRRSGFSKDTSTHIIDLTKDATRESILKFEITNAASRTDSQNISITFNQNTGGNASQRNYYGIIFSIKAYV